MPTIADLCARLQEPKVFASMDPAYEKIKIQRGKIFHVMKSGEEIPAPANSTYLPVSAADMPSANRWESYGFQACNFSMATPIRKWIIADTLQCCLVEQSAISPEIFYAIALSRDCKNRKMFIFDTCKPAGVDWTGGGLFNILFDAIALCHVMRSNHQRAIGDGTGNISDVTSVTDIADTVNIGDAEFENIFRGILSADGLRQFIATWLAGAPGGFIVNNPGEHTSADHGDLIIKTLSPRTDKCYPEHVELWRWVAAELDRWHKICCSRSSALSTLARADAPSALPAVAKADAPGANPSAKYSTLLQSLGGTAADYKYLILRTCEMIDSTQSEFALVRSRPIEINIMKKVIGLSDESWYDLGYLCRELSRERMDCREYWWGKIKAKIDEIVAGVSGLGLSK